ncbi:MAG: efflux RND transporter periplasmic adaptor subunit, partial [Rikenella sp.]|nr:efflux RND transporter periplasmic adaptor subunit [Rikenella sp.]
AHPYAARSPLPNPDVSLLPGMVCREGLEGDSTAARGIVLPNRAVQVDDRGERFVWGVCDGRAVRMPVRVGGLAEGGVVVTQGIETGQRIVTDGYQKISQGMKIREIR